MMQCTHGHTDVLPSCHCPLVLLVQAVKTREALANIPFKACFSSPITRASQTADTIWEGRDGPLIQLGSLREAYLGYLQGMTNDYAKEHHAEVYGALLDSAMPHYTHSSMRSPHAFGH